MKYRVLIIVLVIFGLSSCETVKRRNYVILIDNSTSVQEEVMQRYISIIQETILPNMGEKDRLTLQFIDACSQNMPERIFSFNLAEMDFSDKKDGVNKALDSSRERLNRYLLHTVKNQIGVAVLSKRQERRNCGNFTDIINALNEAGSLIEKGSSYSSNSEKWLNEAQGEENYEYETCIIIFSDMVNENAARTFDFTTLGKLNNDEVNEKVSELKKINKIPDLNGVNFIVYGATSTKNAGVYAGRQIENVKLFWELFFLSSGAELRGYGYDTQMEIKSYIQKR